MLNLLQRIDDVVRWITAKTFPGWIILAILAALAALLGPIFAVSLIPESTERLFGVLVLIKLGAAMIDIFGH